MSHLINLELDRVYGTKPSWHGLETIHDCITKDTISTLIKGKMERFPAYVEINGEKIPLEIDGKPYSVIGERWHDEEENEKITLFQSAAESYQAIDFSRLWDILEKGFEGVPYNITYVGSHSGRAKVWISAELIDADQFIVDGDKFSANINVMDSRDGGTPFVIQDSSTRVVCNNTMSYDLAYASKMSNGFKTTGLNRKERGGLVGIVKHTKNISAEIEYIQRTLPELLSNREAFKTQYKALKSETVKPERVQKILFGFYAKKTLLNLDKGGVLSTRSINQVNAIQNLFHNGRGNHGKTLADLYNAFTEYYTTGDGSGSANVDTFKKMVSSEFGTASDIKRDSFSSLCNDDTVDDLVAMGDKMLKNALDLDMAI